MSGYKTPKTKRQQDMMLHVLGINDMKVDKWLQFFTDDEINWMLNTEEGMTVASRHPLETPKVLQTLREASVLALQRLLFYYLLEGCR